MLSPVHPWIVRAGMPLLNYDYNNMYCLVARFGCNGVYRYLQCWWCMEGWARTIDRIIRQWVDTHVGVCMLQIITKPNWICLFTLNFMDYDVTLRNQRLCLILPTKLLQLLLITNYYLYWYNDAIALSGHTHTRSAETKGKHRDTH